MNYLSLLLYQPATAGIIIERGRYEKGYFNSKTIGGANSSSVCGLFPGFISPGRDHFLARRMDLSDPVLWVFSGGQYLVIQSQPRITPRTFTLWRI